MPQSPAAAVVLQQAIDNRHIRENFDRIAADMGTGENPALDMVSGKVD